jgi:hypothetical protein
MPAVSVSVPVPVTVLAPFGRGLEAVIRRPMSGKRFSKLSGACRQDGKGGRCKMDDGPWNMTYERCKKPVSQPASQPAGLPVSLYLLNPSHDALAVHLLVRRMVWRSVVHASQFRHLLALLMLLYNGSDCVPTCK